GHSSSSTRLLLRDTRTGMTSPCSRADAAKESFVLPGAPDWKSNPYATSLGHSRCASYGRRASPAQRLEAAPRRVHFISPHLIGEGTARPDPERRKTSRTGVFGPIQPSATVPT